MHSLSLSLPLLALLPLALAATIKIDVGEAGLVFKPDSVTAAKGDKLEFHFYPQSHSVAQSTFAKPCEPLDGGIYSGFVPASEGEAKEVFTATVNSTDPIWLYCSRAQHCQDGMVMVVNPPKSGNTLSAYKSSAKSATTSSPASVNGGTLGAATSNEDKPASSASAAASGTSAAPATSAASGTASAAATTGAAVKNGQGAAAWGVLGLLGLLAGGMV